MRISLFISVAVELLSGTLLVYLNWRFKGVGAFLACLLVFAGMLLCVVWLAFHGLALWLNFPVVMFAVLLHLQIDNFRERRIHATAHAGK